MDSQSKRSMARPLLSVNPHAFCFSRTSTDAFHESIVNLPGHRFISFPASPSIDAGNPISGISLKHSRPPSRIRILTVARAASGGGGYGGEGGTRGGGGGGGGGGDSGDYRSPIYGDGTLGLFLQGWGSRVPADSQSPFMVLMEELVGVSARVIGDMVFHSNFDLTELGFVFSTLVVRPIFNFVLTYLLGLTAVTASASAAVSVFSVCLIGQMLETVAYSLILCSGMLVVYMGAAAVTTVELAAVLVVTTIILLLFILR